MYSIYALIDPRDSEIRYVGQTRQAPARRLAEHCVCSGHSQANRKVHAWIAELKLAGQRPVIVVMQQVPTWGESMTQEKHWIRHFLSLGSKLLNKGDGYSHTKRGRTRWPNGANPNGDWARKQRKIAARKAEREALTP